MLTGTTVSDVELTILSLVSEGARYGAEIEKTIELRGLREWLTVGSASVYYILARLEQQELVTRNPAEGEPEKAIYQITDAGRGVVQTAVADLLCQPRPLGQGFALGLANIGVLKPQQAYRALIEHRDSLIKAIEAAEALWERRQRDETPPEGTEALYSHGISVMHAELNWLQGFIDQWRERHPAAVRDDSQTFDAGVATPVHRATEKIDPAKQFQRLKRPHAPPKAE